MIGRMSGRSAALFAFTFLLAYTLANAQSTTYSQSVEFSAVRLSYEDLSELVTRLHGVVEQANSGAECVTRRDTLTVGDQFNSVELTGEFSLTSFARAPLVAHSVNYRYYCLDAPISKVEISLRDFERELSVSGRSRDQVAALSAMAAEMLRPHETAMGGWKFRLLGAYCLALSGLFIPVLATRSPYRAVKVVSWVAGPMMSLSIWVFPWERWFPGAAFYSGDASFLVRHSALISFAGAVLTVITFGISIWYSWRLQRTSTAQSQSPQAPPVSAPRKRKH